MPIPSKTEGMVFRQITRGVCPSKKSAIVATFCWLPFGVGPVGCVEQWSVKDIQNRVSM